MMLDSTMSCNSALFITPFVIKHVTAREAAKLGVSTKHKLEWLDLS